jgi:PAS domain S-box-containing protein
MPEMQPTPFPQNPPEVQNAIERSLEQIRYQALLLNNVRDAVVVWNVSGQITYINPAARALFGWSKEKQLSMPVDTYLRMFTPPVRIPQGEGTGGLKVERCFANSSSQTIWVSSHVYALRDFEAGGRLIGYMDVCRDISENKQMEAQVQIAQTRLIHAARLAAIAELASGVAHHVNNPLTTIIAEAQILLQSLPQQHPARDSAEAIEQAGWRVQKAVQQLLDFSLPAPSMVEYLNVNATITAALELVGDFIDASGVTLQIDLGERLPRLRGNSRQLVDLWVNLLMLAHWSAADGRQHAISIRSSSLPGSTVQVEVSDNGAPLHTGEIDSLSAARFLENSHGRGTGVELALCQEIVRQHRGRIGAARGPNGVTILRVLLPAEA